VDDILHLDHSLITMIWGEPIVMLAKACRGALIARPGKELYAPTSTPSKPASSRGVGLLTSARLFNSGVTHTSYGKRDL